MLFEDYQIVLASGSPRRAELLRSMDISFSVLLKPVNEDYPLDLDLEKVPEFLAKKKAMAYEINQENTLLITADTVVLLDGKILGKPENKEKAILMLKKLSEKSHEVITGVCIRSSLKEIVFCDKTTVQFSVLNSKEIEYYVKQYNPLDKAGAYGIQDWIGNIAIMSIQGSYTNVMGLPTEMLYRQLLNFID